MGVRSVRICDVDRRVRAELDDLPLAAVNTTRVPSGDQGRPKPALALVPSGFIWAGWALTGSLPAARTNRSWISPAMPMAEKSNFDPSGE